MPGAVGTPKGFPVLAGGATGAPTWPWLVVQEARMATGASKINFAFIIL